MVSRYYTLFNVATYLPALFAFSLFGILIQSHALHAAPGAHGPDGEHLATDTHTQVSLKPRFETFSDVFELVGELQHDTIVLYLHDFATNQLITDAQIELELGELVSTADFVATEHHYIIKSPELVQRLHQAGRHELILTIISVDQADLLTASLDNSEHLTPANVAAEHHHHFPWWLLVTGFFILGAGFWLGRRGVTK